MLYSLGFVRVGAVLSSSCRATLVRASKVQDYRVLRMLVGGACVSRLVREHAKAVSRVISRGLFPSAPATRWSIPSSVVKNCLPRPKGRRTGSLWINWCRTDDQADAISVPFRYRHVDGQGGGIKALLRNISHLRDWIVFLFYRYIAQLSPARCRCFPRFVVSEATSLAFSIYRKNTFSSYGFLSYAFGAFSLASYCR